LPGFEGVTWFALAAPARTPDVAIRRLQNELNADPELAKRLATLGAEPVKPSDKDFSETIRDDLAKWGNVISKAGVSKR
jgi:tripartite-type tricarboxylate transporter receptor subunit TctC